MSSNHRVEWRNRVCYQHLDTLCVEGKNGSFFLHIFCYLHMLSTFARLSYWKDRDSQVVYFTGSLINATTALGWRGLMILCQYNLVLITWRWRSGSKIVQNCLTQWTDDLLLGLGKIIKELASWMKQMLQNLLCQDIESKLYFVCNFVV